MLLVIVWLIVAFLLVTVLAMRPARTRHSRSELKRRGDSQVLRREKLLADIIGLRRIVLGLLLVGLAFLGFAAWQGGGVILALVVWLVAGALSRQKFVHMYAMKLYARIEKHLLDVAERAPILGLLFRAENHEAHDQKLESIEHLRHLVEASGVILSPDQRTIIIHGLEWHTTTVGSVMTPLADIVSIKHSELLGPLVLDDLHRSGHKRFPVTKKNLDDIVGILDITQSLDATSGRRSETVEAAMSDRVLYIKVNDVLPTALAMLQKSHLHMLIVVDDDSKTVGVVTLADITESLLGKTEVK